MKILQKVYVFFLTLSILFSLNPVFGEVTSLGKILPYTYYNGQAYFLVAFDTYSKHWDSFNCELEEKDDLYEKISLYAHLGTRGVFAKINDCIINAETSEDFFIATRIGIDFFCDKLNFKKSENAIVYTCNINIFNIDEFLFFVEVPFIPAQTFVDSFYSFQKVYKNCHNDKGYEYLRRTGFAWLKIQDLVNIIEKRKELKMNMARNIILGLLKDKIFLAKTSQLKRRLPGNRIVLSSVLTAELSYDAVMDILKKIINTTQFKCIAKSSNH